MRVYEFAKELDMSTKDFVEKINSLGYKKTNFSTLTETEISDIKSKLVKEKPKEKVEKKDVEVLEKKIIFDSRKSKFKNDKNNEKNNNGERKPFNRNFRENRENNNKDKSDRKFNKDQNKRPFEKRNNNNNNNNNDKEQSDFRKDNKKTFDKKFKKTMPSKDNKEASLEIPTVETETKNKNKLKSKFDKKKYENEKKAKEEERILKELKHDFRKEEKKKKVKKKDKVLKSEVIREEEGGVGMITLSSEVSIKELAEKLGINTSDIIKKFFMQGKILTANAILTFEEAEEIALEYDVIIEKQDEVQLSYGEKYHLEIEDKEEDLELRAPVITIMGHVDHGKTSLLDALRHTNVIEGEAGGITQKIGAYQVTWNNQKITFIDTPGHEAFTEMRSRGANITDIAILIVAADDGVKPQTVEAISHAKEANIPIIVAINKIDKPGANPMKVKQELLEYDLISPEWGGNTEMVEISAKQKLNLDVLLETILLTAEILELKANHKKRAKAVVVESRLDLQLGPVADILIQEGELKVGDIFVSGESHGRVRSMIDDRGNKITKARVSQPIEITGFSELPEAGEQLYCVNNDKQAKKIIEDYKTYKKLKETTKRHISLESLSKELEEKQLKELKCIIRADSKGSVEALKESMLKLSNDKVTLNIIQTSAGAVTEGDIMLAQASDAIIIAFNVRPTNSARIVAEKVGVEIRNYNVIYHVTEDIEKAIKGMLDPEYKENYNGRAEVKEVFKITNVGNIAGSLIVDGKITKGSKIRLLRNGIIIFDGDMLALKRYKDDVKEASIGQECGISFKDFNDIKVGDIIEGYTLEQINK